MVVVVVVVCVCVFVCVCVCSFLLLLLKENALFGYVEKKDRVQYVDWHD